MVIYFVFLAAILVGIVYEQRKPPFSPTARVPAGFLLVLAIGLACGVRDITCGGYDSEIYAWMFSESRNTQFSPDMFFKLGGHEGTPHAVEPGYALFNRIVGWFTDDVNVFFIITALLSYLMLFAHLKKYAPYFFFALLIIFCRQFLQSFVYVRQFLACMVVWWALGFAIKRKPIPFLILIFVATNIHISALIFATVYPVARWKIPGIVMLGGFCVALGAGLTPGFAQLLNVFGDATDNNKAHGYAGGMAGVHIFYAAEALLIAAGILISKSAIYGDQLAKKVRGWTKIAERLPRVAIESNVVNIALFNVTYLYVCASMLTLRNPGAMRLIWVLWIGPICMLPLICEKIVSGALRNVFKALVISYFITAFFLYASRFNQGVFLNYKTFFSLITPPHLANSFRRRIARAKVALSRAFAAVSSAKNQSTRCFLGSHILPFAQMRGNEIWAFFRRKECA